MNTSRTVQARTINERLLDRAMSSLEAFVMQGLKESNFQERHYEEPSKQCLRFTRASKSHDPSASARLSACSGRAFDFRDGPGRSEEHTSELQSRLHLVCRLLLEKKKTTPCV